MSCTVIKTDIESHLLDIASSHALGSFPIDHLIMLTFSRKEGVQFSHLGTASRVEIRGLVADLRDLLVQMEDNLLECTDPDEHPCPTD